MLVWMQWCVRVLEAVGPWGDVAGGWLAGGIGEVAGDVVRFYLGAIDVRDVGEGEPRARRRVLEAGGMTTLLGDVATLMVAVGDGEGAGCVGSVHMVARELWGAVG